MIKPSSTLPADLVARIDAAAAKQARANRSAAVEQAVLRAIGVPVGYGGRPRRAQVGFRVLGKGIVGEGRFPSLL